MKPSFSIFLALRYLKPKRTALSIITLVSIVGVTLGVTVLILVISVMTGFERELQRKVIGFDAHVVVTSPESIAGWEQLAERIGREKGVVAVAPYMQGPVLAEFNHRRMAPKIRGIDPEQEEKISQIRKYIPPGAGALDLDGDKCVVGSELARSLGMAVGDHITIFSPENLEALQSMLDEMERAGKKTADVSELKEAVLNTELEVTGIFESGRYLYDSEFILVPLHIGQEIYGLGGNVHGLAIKTTDPFQAKAVKDEINKHLDPPLAALTWVDLNKQLFDAIRMERNVMFFLLMFIILVAAFGIMNTLITVTVQKTREIGIMKALGAQTAQIVGVFVSQGMVIGLFGTLSGLGLGMWLVQYRNEVRRILSQLFHITIFPADVYQFSEIPAEVVPSDVAIICLTAFAICSLAAVVPAYMSARLDPVKALRYE